MLNGTVTHGLRLTATIDRRGRAVIGNRVGKSKPLGEPLALTVSGASARLELRLLHTLEEEQGLQPQPVPVPLPPITAADVHLVCWQALSIDTAS